MGLFNYNPSAWNFDLILDPFEVEFDCGLVNLNLNGISRTTNFIKSRGDQKHISQNGTIKNTGVQSPVHSELSKLTLCPLFLSSPEQGSTLALALAWDAPGLETQGYEATT